MNTKKLLFLIIILITKNTFSQSNHFEIAKKNYKKSVEFESKNIDSSFIYIKKAYASLIPNDTINKTFADILNQYGRIYFYKKEYTIAYSYFNRCFDITQLNGEQSDGYKVKVNMAICQKQLNNTEKALSDFFDVVKFYEEQDALNINLGKTYFNIANLYFSNKQHLFAEDYYNKSEPFFKDDKPSLYHLQGSRIANFNSYNVDKSLKLIEQIKANTNFDSIPIFMRGILYNNMAQTMVKIEDYDKALSYTLKGLNVKKRGGLKTGISIQYNNVGDIYIKTKKYRSAITYLDSALQYATTNRQKFQILQNLQKAHKENNNLEKSLQYANFYIALKDSLNEVLTQKEIVELGIKYETKEKNRFIEKLQNLSNIYKVLIFLIVLLSAFVLRNLFIKNRKIKKEFEILQKELNLFKEEKLNSKELINNELIHLKSKAILNSNEILYVKSDGHYVDYYLKNRSNPEIDRNSLSEVLQMLPTSSFVRIHNSFIVNIYHIKIINSTKVMLDNGEWINLSRTYKQQLKDILHKED